MPKPLSVSLVVMPPRHHQPALPSLIGELRQILYQFWQRKLAQERDNVVYWKTNWKINNYLQ
jgi:hypothetical protein